MRRLALILALALGACVATPPPDLRDSDVAISSSTRFEAGRFAGEWTTLAVAGDGLAPRFAVSPDGAGQLIYTPTTGRAGRLSVEGPGRLTGAGREIWVLWVSETHDLAALGNPQGSFAQIISKTATARPDRLAAAREVLAFNGYDLSAIREVPQ